MIQCSFITSYYEYPNFVQVEWRISRSSSYIPIMPSRFEVSKCKWEDVDHITTRLIKSVTPNDSGLYFCFIKYSTDIIQQEAKLPYGEVSLKIGM